MNKILSIACASLLLISGCPKATPSVPRPPEITVIADPSPKLSDPETATWQGPPPVKPQRPGADERPKIVKISERPEPVVVAHIKGKPITLEQLSRPCIDAYGLKFLIHLVQVELSREKAAAVGTTATPAQVEKEWQLTMNELFRNQDNAGDLDPKEFPRLMEQFLQNQHISRQEWDLAMQMRANIRIACQAGVDGAIKEENVQEAFRIMYGEKVKVRHITLNNLREVAQARALLQSGVKFADVALRMSTDKLSSKIGGELRAFSRADLGMSDEFKNAAFELKNTDEVSDPISTGGGFEMIQLIARIQPKAVKYEDVRESVRQELSDRLLGVRMKNMQDELREEALKSMSIVDPNLKHQLIMLQERGAGANGMTSKDVSESLKRNKYEPVGPAGGSGAPGSMIPKAGPEGTAIPVAPAENPQPNGPAEVGRPPATMPGH